MLLLLGTAASESTEMPGFNWGELKAYEIRRARCRAHPPCLGDDLTYILKYRAAAIYL